MQHFNLSHLAPKLLAQDLYHTIMERGIWERYLWSVSLFVNERALNASCIFRPEVFNI